MAHAQEHRTREPADATELPLRSRRSVRLERLIVTGLIVLLGLAVPHAASASEASGGIDNPEALDAFVGELMAEHLDQFGFAGATLTVVKDDTVLLSKGYGHADISGDVPVDAESTLFATGSVAKLFTWTAVMQLVERGQLDLDGEVNDYLTGFQIPATFHEPIRVRHLLSHTAGFEDRPVVGAFAKDSSEIPDLETALIRFVPARDRAPGMYTAYSNYGAALAGHLVAEVSGLSWEEYLERNIFAPLGMSRSSTRQPVPDDLARDVAKVYDAGEGGLVESFVEYSTLPPAGAMVSTSADMGRFMLAHLGGGSLNGARILEQATVEQMHSQLFTHDLRLGGNAHGFWEHNERGHRVISHGGDLNTSHALLALVPDRDLGFYVAYNSVGGPEAREAFAQAFWDYALADEPQFVAPAVETGSLGSIDRFAGSYANTRMASTTLTKLLAPLSVLTVSVADDNVLVTEVAGFLGPQRWVRVAEDEFVQADGPARMIFGEKDGRTSHVVFGGSGLTAYSPLTAFLPADEIDSPALHGALLLTSVLLLLSGLVLWPIMAAVQWRRRTRAEVRQRIARWSAAAAGGLYLLFIVLLVMVVSNPTVIEYGMAPLLVATLSVGIAAAVLTVVVLVQAVLTWRNGDWRLVTRIHYTAVAVALVALGWQMNHWNLLGFHV